MCGLCFFTQQKVIWKINTADSKVCLCELIITFNINEAVRDDTLKLHNSQNISVSILAACQTGLNGDGGLLKKQIFVSFIFRRMLQQVNRKVRNVSLIVPMAFFRVSNVISSASCDCRHIKNTEGHVISSCGSVTNASVTVRVSCARVQTCVFPI